MIIILLGIYVIGVFPYLQFIKQEISMYPTVGEFYQYYLGSFFDGSQLMCKMYPKVPNVQVMNQCQEISQKQGNQFKSMSSNNTHFGTLTYDNQVIIYEWKNQMIEQIGQSVPIDSSFNCFNINLSKDFSILIDCYYNNEFLLIQLIDAQSIITYSIQSYIPTQTKIQSIINGTKAFIVYAQYFHNYSILSLLSSSFYYLSSLNNQFIDFDIPITISPNIYAITSQEIFQLSISSDSQFYYKYNFSKMGLSNFNTISVYYDLWSYSQCDQILLSLFQGFYIALWGCENQIIYGYRRNYHESSNKYVIKILQNNQFIIFQLIDEIIILNQMLRSYYYYKLFNTNNSLLYFNSDNELFSFNQDIIVYKISITSLQVNLTNLENAGNNYTFSLRCMKRVIPLTYIKSKFFIQVLPQNDTNIYVMFNQDYPQYQYSTDSSFSQINSFLSYSGQLLQYKLNPNGIPLNFTLFTLQKIGEINQSYQLVSFILANEEQYLIGYGNQSLDIFFCFSYQFQCILLNSINISVNASTLQIAYSMYPFMIIIGLSTNETIYLFQYYNNKNISYSNYTFEQQFSDFLVSYNSIIILILNKEIKIMTFNFTNTFTLNQQSINKLFTNIEFNPIQIVMNTQLLSSLLYINNINEVIIISIDQNSFPIPISLIQVNFKIKQINLVNQQLILSYRCNNQQNLCFQVLNVQHLPKFYYVKNLQSVNYDNNIIIQSDNLFFYVTFSNYTVYVYNPLLPYHMTLYYMLELTSPIQCAQASPKSSSLVYSDSLILLSDNTIYKLNRFQQYQITQEFYNQNFNNLINYPQFIYNYNVTSVLNDTALQQTPNQSLTLYSNFIIFQNQTNISVNINTDNIIPYSKNFTYPMNLILDRQVGYCRSTNKYCNLTQFSNQSIGIFKIQNYSLITSINNEFFALQNNFNIQTINNLNNISNFNYQNLNLSECLLSTSSDYSLYSICQNSTSQYLLNFTFNSYGNIVNLNTTQLQQTVGNISKISSVLNQIFILGTCYSDISDNCLQWLNQSNNTFQDIFYCSDFTIEQIQDKKFSSQLIIIFSVFYSNVNYIIMSIDNQGIKKSIGNSVVILLCTLQSSCSEYQPSQLNTILILQIIYNKAIILISDMYFSYIIQISSLTQSQHQEVSGIITGTIPNYGNLINTGQSYYKNGVLMQQFSISNQSQYVVGVYYINNLQDGNLTTPILMQGSFNTTNTNYAMIIDQQYQNGTSLYIYNQSIHNYSISTWNITCLAYTNNNSMKVEIFCGNEFSNGTYQITFNLPSKFRLNFGPSAYALLTIICILLLYFCIKVKYKTRNYGYLSSEIEL